MKSQLRGVFLTSENPKVTADFYKKVAGIPLKEIGPRDARYWKVDGADIQLAIHNAKLFSDYTHPSVSKSNLTHLYFKIENQKAFLSHLNKIGLKPYRADEVVITVLDPDGRKVMFGTA